MIKENGASVSISMDGKNWERLPATKVEKVLCLASALSSQPTVEAKPLMLGRAKVRR